MSELKRTHGMGRLRVRKAAKVSFAVACKVIACNIKRWARAAASAKPLQRIYCHILTLMDLVQFFKEQLRSSNVRFLVYG